MKVIPLNNLLNVFSEKSCLGMTNFFMQRYIIPGENVSVEEIHIMGILIRLSPKLRSCCPQVTVRKQAGRAF